MRKTKKVKVHTVKAKLQVLELTKAGSSMEFEIFANEEKVGTIIIGRGSFKWIGKGGWEKKSGKKYSWTRFAEIMDYLEKSPLRIPKS